MTAAHVLTILAVDDLPRSVDFYRRAFGWALAVDVPVYAELALPGGMRLGLYGREGFARAAGAAPGRPAAGAPGAVAPTELYLHVDDLDAAVERLAAAGARPLSARAARDWGDEAAYFTDPDGHVVVVARPLGPDAAAGTPAALRALARRWLALWERDDIDGEFDALHAADFVDHSPADRAGDRAAFREGIRELRRAFPDFAATASDLHVDAAGGTVTVLWSAAGTHRGPFLGRPATGRIVRFRGIELIRVEGGHIVERWGEWDGLDLQAQLA
jgi:steroid delta-isomerase-like uncharacterized protein